MLPTMALGVEGWVLRGWQTGDAPALARHANNLKVWRNMSDGFRHPYTLEIAEHWVRQGHVEFGGDNWAITLNDEAVGGCGLHQESGQFRCNAELGWWLAEAHWGKGIGTRVAAALVERAFAHLEITRVYAPVHAGNLASMRVAEKNGFVLEGVQPQSALKDGHVIDRWVWGKYKR